MWNVNSFNIICFVNANFYENHEDRSNISLDYKHSITPYFFLTIPTVKPVFFTMNKILFIFMFIVALIIGYVFYQKREEKKIRDYF